MLRLLLADTQKASVKPVMCVEVIVVDVFSQNFWLFTPQKPAAWSSSPVSEASTKVAAFAVLCIAPCVEGSVPGITADPSGEAPGRLSSWLSCAASNFLGLAPGFQCSCGWGPLPTLFFTGGDFMQ